MDAHAVATGSVTAGDVMDAAAEKYASDIAGHVAPGATRADVDLRQGYRAAVAAAAAAAMPVRKPTVERRAPQPGDKCPVCFDALEEKPDGPPLSWCRYVRPQ